MKKHLLLPVGILIIMSALFADSIVAHQLPYTKIEPHLQTAHSRPCHPAGDVVQCGHALHFGGDLIGCQHICNGLYGPVVCHPAGDVVPCVHPAHSAGDLVPCAHFCY